METEKKYSEALEKAKAYDEALDRMKHVVVVPKDEKALQALKETIFPELRESEDEKIRKAIRLILIATEDEQKDFYSTHELTRKDCTDWLEKQKDASKAIEAVERIDKYIDEHLANAHDMKDSNPEKKYYRGWDDALGEMARILQDVYSDEKQKEQKPNYCHHEVDETGWTKEYRKAYYDGWNNCNMQHEQCKAEQKPVEWSEEDEETRKDIIAILEQFGRGLAMTTREKRDKMVSWMKNLRPSWKPSEEQMEALNKVRTLNPGLDALYQQLKNM